MTLFLGMPFNQEMFQQPPEVVKLFMGGNYLQKIERDGHSFIGKSAGSRCSLTDLALLHDNICSLVKRLAPIQNPSLTLFLC